MKCWLYHNKHGGQIFDLPDDEEARAEELKQREKFGWVDSPEKLPVESAEDEAPPKKKGKRES